MPASVSQPKRYQGPEELRLVWSTTGLVIWIGFLLITTGGVAKAQEALPDTAPFRIAFASSMFTDVNENDARAAVKVWAQTVAKEQGIKTDPEPSIITGSPALSRALKSNRVDAVGMTTSEYAVLRQELKFNPIFVTYSAGRIYEEYILLVHRDSGIEDIGDLKGRRLTFYQNARASLAQTWLDTLLFQNRLSPMAAFFGQVSHNSKLPRVILPVFFRQSDACLVTRNGFDIMNELNPQTGKQLKIIASSPEFVPAVFCFRANYSPAFKARLLAGIRELHTTPAGQQMLTIFHSEKIAELPTSCLQSALDLIETHKRLRAASKGGTTGLKSRVRTAKQDGGG